MKDFVNPKSMLTPGIAGSLMMFLVNGIACQFPEIPIRYLALFLSFLIGAVVWFSETEGTVSVIQKAIYWVLNSLVIFVVGFGAANLAADAALDASKVAVPHVRLLPSVSAAFAQVPCPQETMPSSSGQAQPPSVSQSHSELQERLSEEQAENLRLKTQIEEMQRDQETSKPSESEKRFFKRW